MPLPDQPAPDVSAIDDGSPAGAGERSLAGRIQHTLIRPGVRSEELERHCRECLEYGFQAAMIPANWVPEAKQLLAGSAVRVASAVDFPYGAMTTAGRVAEARAIIEAGADEIDIGVPLGWFLARQIDRFRDDLAAVVRAAAPAPVKVMLELPLVPRDRWDALVDAAVAAGVRYVKNASSGAVGVATPEEIAYLRARVPATVGVKASGGIKTAAQVRALLAAGADLVGTSNGIAIVTGSARPADTSY